MCIRDSINAEYGGFPTGNSRSRRRTCTNSISYIAMAEHLKPLKPVMAIAKTMEDTNPTVAYFCEMYAIEKAMKAKGEHPEASDVIVPVLKEMFKACEQHKAKIPESTQLNQGESIVNAAASKYLEEARAADEAGRGDKQTAHNYVQAMVLFEVTQQFQDPMPPAVAEKHQFSTQRAQVIRKALQSGQQFAPAPTTTPTTSAPAHAPALAPIAVTPGPPCWQPAKQMQSRDDLLDEARRQTLFASNALMFQDLLTAVNCTKAALQLLDHAK
eukprot:TRINITY_DN2552_c0_g1_i5.p1 TRINITY_DN2552_c0_g1~~TRINITY_DN2552_c0_g1_i5.p1  ORF type:complete len:271 (+),score=60.52 TRINITY_DN2552_c0_g1_i5:123-935(+)